MQTLDEDINLKYSLGRLFPSNVVFIGFLFLTVALFALMMGGILPFLIMALIGSFTALSYQGIIFDPEKKQAIEFVYWFGFIKKTTTIQIDKYAYFSVIPKRISNTVYSRSTNHTTYTEYKFAICLLKMNYSGKKELIYFESKSKAETIAKRLAELMNLEFFDYNPQEIRKRMGR